METTRCCYAAFSFDNKKEHLEQYLDNKSYIETALHSVKSRGLVNYKSNEIVGASINLTRDIELTACIYKQRLFLATIDKRTREISFNERTAALAKNNVVGVERLMQRMENAVNHHKTGAKLLGDLQIEKSWEPLIPTMDRIIEYEKELEKFPESRQQIMRNSKLYDQRIEEIISSGEKQMHPLIEQAWEEITGKDVGHVGKRNIDGPMSTLEEDRLEKHYHKDIGRDGFVDEKFAVSEELTFGAADIKERFAEVKEAARELSVPQKESISREREDEREIERTTWKY